MKSLTHFRRCLCSFIMLVCVAVPALAQQDNASPKPAARVYAPVISGTGEQDAQAESPAVNPDQTSLTGAQEFTLGSPEMRHNYWVPGFQFNNMLQSKAQGTAGTGNWISSSYLVGTLSLINSSRHSELRLNYSGGGVFSNSSTIPNSSYHQFSLSQQFEWRRWSLLFADQFAYLPQSSFGFGGVSNISSPGVGGSFGASFPGLQTSYVPNQSIFTSNGTRYNNAFISQLEYALTPRSSLTAVGSFGILRFIQANGIDTNDAIGSLGYNYQVTRSNTVGVLYRFTSYRYIGNPQALNDHATNFAYGRKITGRLALQVFGGPDVTVFRHSIGTDTSRVNFSAGAMLAHAYERSNVWLSYSRGLAGGSGVLVGAVRDQVEGRVSNRFSRLWEASVGMGFARNGAIAAGTAAVGSQNFNSLFVSGGLNRMLGRTASFSVNYTFDYQNLNPALCIAASCGANYTLHQLWVGFQWRAHPFVIR